MSEIWVTIGVLAVGTALIRASGPVILGGRELPQRVMDVIALLAPALLAALVVVETFTGTRPDPRDRRPRARPRGGGRRPLRP